MPIFSIALCIVDHSVVVNLDVFITSFFSILTHLFLSYLILFYYGLRCITNSVLQICVIRNTVLHRF